MPQFLVPVIQAIGTVAGVALSATAAGYIASAAPVGTPLALSAQPKRTGPR